MLTEQVVNKVKLGWLIACVPILWSCNPAPEPYTWQIPDGFPTPNVPQDNPMSDAKVELGKALFFEPALSGNGAMSCSTCHLPEHAFSEPRTTSSGSTGDHVRRNAMALVNVAYNGNLTCAHNGLTSKSSSGKGNLTIRIMGSVRID